MSRYPVSDRQKKIKEKTHFLLISGTSLKKRAGSVAGLKAMYILREQVYSICSAQNTFIIYIFTRMRNRVFAMLCICTFVTQITSSRRICNIYHVIIARVTSCSCIVSMQNCSISTRI